jgi:HAD superfamily hydrolase (TIGR01490 family)
MGLALFDLDHTLIGGDSDVLWGQYLAERGAVDPTHHEAQSLRYYEDYRAGRLDINAFLEFQLEVLAREELEVLHAWRRDFLRQKIDPIVLPRALALVERHRQAGDTLAIVTATNRFITEPIAAIFAVPHLIATEPELRGGRYTGKVLGVPSFAAGKVTRLEEWLAAQGREFAESWFYSDSHNDLPLLERTTHPVAVDPDPQLAAEARRRGWPILSLRDAP